MILASEDKWRWIWQACHPQWWIEPVLGKELRVASRQRKYYWLRLAYVCLLVVVIVHFWHIIVQIGGGGSGVGQVSRLGETGKRVIVTIVWFQFLTAQVLAIALLSDAISSEVRQRTLESLLVTPAGAAQIVLGKLFGRLLYVVLFLAISLPVLGVARAFGGVPWDYVVSGLGITCSTMLLAGALSLYYSIRYRQAHRVVLEVGRWYFYLCGLDIFSLLVWAKSVGATAPLGVSQISPFGLLLVRTQAVLTGPTAGRTPAPLAWHCLILLTVTVIVLVCAVRQVRRIGRDPALGLDGGTFPHPTTPPSDPWQAVKQALAERTMRRVEGPPVVWRELGAPRFSTRSGVLLYLGLCVGVSGPIVVLMTWADSILRPALSEVAWALQWVFFIRLGLAAAGSVTREKEAGTWPVLLATPLEDGEIIQGKALAALRRNLLLLIPLLVIHGLMALFSPASGSALPRWVPWMSAPVVHLLGTTLFLTGAGLLAGLRCRTTAAALAWLFGTYFVLMLVAGLLAAGRLDLLMPGSGGDTPGPGVSQLVVGCVGGGLGLIALRESVWRLRRHVF